MLAWRQKKGFQVACYRHPWHLQFNFESLGANEILQ